MNEQPLSVALVSLGCPKNLVDSEYMADAMREDGMEMVQEAGQAEVIVVNTCGFIESAKKEAIETILEMAEYKTAGSCRYLIVTGCLAQRYAKEMKTELPEVDAILGVGAYGKIVETIHSLYQEGEEHLPLCNNRRGFTTAHFKTQRTPSTSHYAYLKIAEGCSNRCAYCAIPAIRGQMISRPVEEIVQEAQNLLQQGFRELVIVAQDTTAYGMDLYGERRLPALLDAICDLPGDFGLRLLYCYSDGMTDELLETVCRQKKVIPYIDMPIQHGSDYVLRLMGRKDTAEGIRSVVQKWRKAWPRLVFRTTVMVGFPGEREEDFEDLMALIQDLRFERLGCFIFSPEEGTRAASMPHAIHPELAQSRYDRLMACQQEISLAYHRSRLHQVYEMSIESISDDGIFFLGRSYAESPDIDPLIHVLAGTAPLETMAVVRARVVEADAYDLTAITEA